jgi:hypothetical protein
MTPAYKKLQKISKSLTVALVSLFPACTTSATTHADAAPISRVLAVILEGAAVVFFFLCVCPRLSLCVCVLV